MNPTAIRVDGVGKSFRVPLDRPATLKYRVTHPRSSSRSFEFHALDDITFDVPRGQFLGIIGHNGCGKSTLLKILARIYTPDRGSVEIDGQVSPFLELGVGFNPELTARENVYLNGAVLGITRAELDRRVDHILRFAEVEHQAGQKLKNFSSGMQVRLAFSVAIQADAEILLMDEVLAVGDARFAEKCFDVFARYKRDGKTIVLVTHDLGSVQMYCDRTILIDHGRVIADGQPHEVTAQYRRLMGEDPSPADTAEETGRAVVVAGDAVPPPEGTDAGQDRWGGREVAISSVRLLDAAGRPTATLTTNRAATVEVRWRARDTVPAVTAALSVNRSDGVLVFGATSRGETDRSLPAPAPGEEGGIRYEIPALPLLGGGYHLSVGVYDEHGGHAYDHIERAVPFHVVDERPHQGLCDLQGRFTEMDLPAAAAPLAS